MLFQKKSLAIILSSTLLLTACGGGGGGGSSDSTGSTTDTTVTGSVMKGPVNAASITIYQMNSDGTQGSAVAGPFTSDNKGAWSGMIPKGISGPLIAVATQGSYTDEATSQTVSLASDDRMLGVIPEMVGDNVFVAITPYTHAITLSAAHYAATDGVSTAISNSIDGVKGLIGFDPTNTLPVDPMNLPSDATANQKFYAAMLGGFSRMLQEANIKNATNGQPAFKVVNALATDMADSKLDGKDLAGNTVNIAAGSAMPAFGTSLFKLVSNVDLFIKENATPYTGVSLPSSLRSFTLPTTVAGQTVSLTFCCSVGNAPYTNGDKIQFTFQENGTLVLMKSLQQTLVANTFIVDSHGQYVWVASNGTQYVLALNNGVIHEVNIMSSTGTFLGQFQ